VTRTLINDAFDISELWMSTSKICDEDHLQRGTENAVRAKSARSKRKNKRSGTDSICHNLAAPDSDLARIWHREARIGHGGMKDRWRSPKNSGTSGGGGCVHRHSCISRSTLDMFILLYYCPVNAGDN